MRRRELITGVAALAAFSALQPDPVIAAIGRQPRPDWVMPGAFADFDFRNLRAYGAPISWRSPGSINPGLSGVQNGNGISACYLQGADGVFRLCAANSIKIADGVGLACFDNSVYYALQNRDFTNAVWTKTNCTASRTTGADGVSNSGSRLTATGANWSCIQTITLGAAMTALPSVIAKAVTRSGSLWMSIDGGTTKIDLVAGGLTTAFKQLWDSLSGTSTRSVGTTVPFGFGGDTGGDIIDFDFGDLEGGGNACPVVPGPRVAVTTASVTRFREIPEINNGRGGGGYANGALGDRWMNAINSGSAAMYVEFMGNPATATGAPATTDGIQLFGPSLIGSGLSVVGAQVTSNAVQAGWNRAMSGYASSNTAGGGGAILRGCLNGGPLVSATGTAGNSTTTHMVLGGNGSGANALNGYIGRVALFDRLPPDWLFIERTRLS